MNIWLGGLARLTIELGQGLTFFQIGSHWQPSPFISLSCNLSLSSCSTMLAVIWNLSPQIWGQVWSFDGTCVMCGQVVWYSWCWEFCSCLAKFTNLRLYTNHFLQVVFCVLDGRMNDLWFYLCWKMDQNFLQS